MAHASQESLNTIFTPPVVGLAASTRDPSVLNPKACQKKIDILFRKLIKAGETPDARQEFHHVFCTQRNCFTEKHEENGPI